MIITGLSAGTTVFQEELVNHYLSTGIFVSGFFSKWENQLKPARNRWSKLSQGHAARSESTQGNERSECDQLFALACELI